MTKNKYRLYELLQILVSMLWGYNFWSWNDHSAAYIFLGFLFGLLLLGYMSPIAIRHRRIRNRLDGYEREMTSALKTMVFVGNQELWFKFIEQGTTIDNVTEACDWLSSIEVTDLIRASLFGISMCLIDVKYAYNDLVCSELLNKEFLAKQAAYARLEGMVGSIQRGDRRSRWVTSDMDEDDLYVHRLGA